MARTRRYVIPFPLFASFPPTHIHSSPAPVCFLAGISCRLHTTYSAVVKGKVKYVRIARINVFQCLWLENSRETFPMLWRCTTNSIILIKVVKNCTRKKIKCFYVICRKRTDALSVSFIYLIRLARDHLNSTYLSDINFLLCFFFFFLSFSFRAYFDDIVNLKHVSIVVR